MGLLGQSPGYHHRQATWEGRHPVACTFVPGYFKNYFLEPKAVLMNTWILQAPGGRSASWCCVPHAGKPLSGDLLQAEVAGIILGGLDTSAQTCAFTLCGTALRTDLGHSQTRTSPPWLIVWHA